MSELYTAGEAMALGLASEVVDDDRVLSRTPGFAAGLARTARLATRDR